MPTGLYLHIPGIVNELRSVEARWASLPPFQLRLSITDAIFDGLSALHITWPFLINHVSADQGCFNPGSWTLAINSAWPMDATLPDQIRLQIAEYASAVIHETRHCEQFWRMGRLWRDRQRNRGLLCGGQEIEIHLRILRSTAVAIAASPPLTGRMEIVEAQEWYESTYGSGQAFYTRTQAGVCPYGLRETGIASGRQHYHTTFSRYERGLPIENDARCIELELRTLYLEPYGLPVEPLHANHPPVRRGVSEYSFQGVRSGGAKLKMILSDGLF
jgi:hypothetical protein